nr:tRNA pseudouridine(55) synthase TruB [Chloroflexota bacterium]
APSREAVAAALTASRGPIEQRPPAYSAIKVAGRRAYAMARAGESVELAPRSVTIHALDLISWDDATPGEPIAILDVECSAGTYIRSLARDLGAAVGSAAYLGALTRTASGPFEIGAAIELEAIRAAASDGPASVAGLLLPIDAGLELPTVAVPDSALVPIGRGQAIGVPPGTGPLDADLPIRLVDGNGRLLAIARLVATKLAPDKVLFDAPSGDQPA